MPPPLPLSLADLDPVRAAPAAVGSVELIVRRPTDDQREVLELAELTRNQGLVGDSWVNRGSRHTPDGSSELERQLTVMSARAIALLEPDRSRWPLAGDQLFVDFDISDDNLPAGSRVAVGTAVIEVSAAPHTGCAKFSARFGAEALRLVNSPEGRQLRLRGLNARVVVEGTVKPGDPVRKLEAP